MMKLIFASIGVFLILFGMASIFFPGLQKYINAPGEGVFKSIICIAVGIIFIAISSFIHI